MFIGSRRFSGFSCLFFDFDLGIIHSNELYIFVFDHLLCLPWWDFIFGSWFVPIEFITNDGWHKLSQLLQMSLPLVSTKFLCVIRRQRSLFMSKEFSFLFCVYLFYCRLRDRYKNMVADLDMMRSIVVHVLVRKRYLRSFTILKLAHVSYRFCNYHNMFWFQCGDCQSFGVQ